MNMNLNDETLLRGNFNARWSSCPEPVDPQHFADGQRWATEGGLAVGRIGAAGFVEIFFGYLNAHFDAGGNIANALKWMTVCVPDLSCRERRCVVSYVVRWVRVLRVTRRMQEAGKPAFSVDDPIFQQLRRVIISVLGISDVLLAYRDARDLAVNVPALGHSWIAAAEKLIDARMAYNVSVSRVFFSLPDGCIVFTPAGLKWLADGAAD